MAVRSVFLRSPLGSRIKSPLGAFVCRAETLLEIKTVPLYLEDGLTYMVTGEYFGDTQGTGTLIISNTPDQSDINVTQTVDAWSDTELTFDFDDGGTLTADGPVWVRVESDAGQFDTAMTQIALIAGLILDGDATLPAFGANDGLIVAGIIVDSCTGNNFPLYCGPQFRINLDDTGYGPAADFIADSPGFSIGGQFSGKSVTLEQATFVSAAGDNRYVWAGPSEGIAAHGTVLTAETFRVSVLYFFSSCQPNTGGYTSCAADPGGWDYTSPGPGEDVYLVPTYPVSIQITAPAPDTVFPTDSDITLTGVAYGPEGEISDNIAWSYDDGGGDTPIDTGASVLWEDVPNGSYAIYARVTNSAGQWRYAQISITVETPVVTVDAILPTIGDEAGGARVFIVGSGFSALSTVEFGGTPATSVTYYDANTLLAVAPAGTGSVDVEVFTGPASGLSPDQFVYSTVTDIFVDSITPDNDVVTGGASVTISGSGFNANCTVIIGGLPADNITFVNSTTITCDIPDATGEPGVPGVVHVLVFDTVVETACVLPYGFTYT